MHKKGAKLFKVTLFLILIGGGYFLGKRFFFKAPEYFLELPDGFYSYGIDVSHHQNKIDWNTVLANTNISFVYCKATEGVEHVDTQWETNRKILLKKGVPHGAYHFFIPNKSPLKQAKNFLQNYHPEITDLPPVLDAEKVGKSPSDFVKNMRIWLEEIEKKTDKRPIIYTSYNIYKENIKTHFPEYKFWIANYNNITARFTDSNILFWQFSDNGVLPGISERVDLNYSKIDFNKE